MIQASTWNLRGRVRDYYPTASQFPIGGKAHEQLETHCRIR
jgi:hypothetical protein